MKNSINDQTRPRIWMWHSQHKSKQHSCKEDQPPFFSSKDGARAKLSRQLRSLLGIRKVKTTGRMRKAAADGFKGDLYHEISDATNYKSTARSAAVLARASIFCWKRLVGEPGSSRKNMRTLGGEPTPTANHYPSIACWLVIQTNFGT